MENNIQQPLQPLARVVKQDPTKTLYLICLKGTEEDIWNIVEGRESAYEFIKDNIDGVIIDESFILAENQPLRKRKPIYTYMKYVEKFFPDDRFDIDDYKINPNNDRIEEIKEAYSYNEVDPIFNESREQISPQDIMNSDIRDLD